MTNDKNPKVDQYLSEIKRWGEELRALRTLVLDAGMVEELKWRAPCYTFRNSNVVILGSYKEYCAISFFKGALLKDPHAVLIKQGENSRSARIIRFTSMREMTKLQPTVKAYLQEAIEIEKAGLKIEFQQESELKMPEEFSRKLNDDPAMRAAFEALTPSRQRGYLLHFSGAKQAKSREARIEKCLSRILDGKGLQDCTCGLSKRMPNCDGSHKQLT